LVEQLVGMLQELNPEALVVPTSRCDVELQEVLLTGRFDMEQVGCYNCYNSVVFADWHKMKACHRLWCRYLRLATSV
jgi:G3E family GTPase